MDDVDFVESPLAVTAGAAGPHATEAFALLGDETRLAILLALWERYDPHAEDNAVPFSEIFDRVEYDDSGNLSYHLEKLDGQFVRQPARGEGYELRRPGLALVQAVIAGAGVQDETLEPTEIDQACPRCDAPTAIGYQEGILYQVCTECEGPTPEPTDRDGFLNAVPFDPAGLADRTPEQLRAASRVGAIRHLQTMFDGLCPACSGPVDGWLDACPDHDTTGICAACGTTFHTWARFECRICKNHQTTSPKAIALFHPAVISFYDDHGVSTRIHADDFESVNHGFDLIDGHEMDLVSEDPPRVVVTATRNDDQCCVTFDETVSVVDVDR